MNASSPQVDASAYVIGNHREDLNDESMELSTHYEEYTKLNIIILRVHMKTKFNFLTLHDVK